MTLTYKLDVIDAIDVAIADPRGHFPWFADRHSIINQNLTFVLQHEYLMYYSQRNANTETSSEKWFIDKSGYVRKRNSQ